MLLCDEIIETVEYDVFDEADSFFEGIGIQFPFNDPNFNPRITTIQTSLKSSFQLLFQSGIGLDLCEICGGEARTSTIAIRRQLEVGENFDLVTHCDLIVESNRGLVEQ